MWPAGMAQSCGEVLRGLHLVSSHVCADPVIVRDGVPFFLRAVWGRDVCRIALDVGAIQCSGRTCPRVTACA